MLNGPKSNCSDVWTPSTCVITRFPPIPRMFEAIEAETGHVVLDVDAGLVLHQIGEALEHAPLDGLVVHDRHRAGGLHQRRRPQRRGDGHRVEKVSGWPSEGSPPLSGLARLLLSRRLRVRRLLRQRHGGCRTIRPSTARTTPAVGKPAQVAPARCGCCIAYTPRRYPATPHAVPVLIRASSRGLQAMCGGARLKRDAD